MMEKYSAQPIQAMPLLENKVNLVAGTHTVKHLIHCAATGSVTVTWPTNATAIIPMVAGQDYTFNGSITITTGTYHVY